MGRAGIVADEASAPPVQVPIPQQAPCRPIAQVCRAPFNQKNVA